MKVKRCSGSNKPAQALAVFTRLGDIEYVICPVCDSSVRRDAGRIDRHYPYVGARNQLVKK